MGYKKTWLTVEAAIQDLSDGIEISGKKYQVKDLAEETDIVWVKSNVKGVAQGKVHPSKFLILENGSLVYVEVPAAKSKTSQTANPQPKSP